MTTNALSVLDNVKLNCQGILMLQEKKNLEAIICFSLGLRSIHSGSGILAVDHDAKKQNVDRQPPAPPYHDILVSVVLAREDLRVTHTDFGFALYNRALHLPSDEIEEHSTKQLGLHNGIYDRILSAVFLYNIGLAHHLEALRNGESKILVNAINFYALAHQQLTVEQPSLDGKRQLKQEKNSNLALLALLNNMGHIHTVFRDYEAIKLCGSELVQRLSTLVDLPLPSVHDLVLFSEHYKEFLLNAGFFSVIALMPAPSA
jgi:hypothetical protein